MVKEAKTFDITEYAKKAREALNRLEQTQQPVKTYSTSTHFLSYGNKITCTT